MFCTLSVLTATKSRLARVRVKLHELIRPAMYTELNDTVVRQPLQNGIMRGAHLTIVFES